MHHAAVLQAGHGMFRAMVSDTLVNGARACWSRFSIRFLAATFSGEFPFQESRRVVKPHPQAPTFALHDGAAHQDVGQTLRERKIQAQGHSFGEETCVQNLQVKLKDLQAHYIQ